MEVSRRANNIHDKGVLCDILAIAFHRYKDIFYVDVFACLAMFSQQEEIK
jgi:hypothetical protein